MAVKTAGHAYTLSSLQHSLKERF